MGIVINALLLICLLTTIAECAPFDIANLPNCHGKGFLCHNATHFIVCVDIGDEITVALGDLQPCTYGLTCSNKNKYECQEQIAETNKHPSVAQITDFVDVIDSGKNATPAKRYIDGNVLSNKGINITQDGSNAYHDVIKKSEDPDGFLINENRTEFPEKYEIVPNITPNLQTTQSINFNVPDNKIDDGSNTDLHMEHHETPENMPNSSQTTILDLQLHQDKIPYYNMTFSDTTSSEDYIQIINMPQYDKKLHPSTHTNISKTQKYDTTVSVPYRDVSEDPEPITDSIVTQQFSLNPIEVFMLTTTEEIDESVTSLPNSSSQIDSNEQLNVPEALNTTVSTPVEAIGSISETILDQSGNHQHNILKVPFNIREYFDNLPNDTKLGIQYDSDGYLGTSRVDIQKDSVSTYNLLGSKWNQTDAIKPSMVLQNSEDVTQIASVENSGSRMGHQSTDIEEDVLKISHTLQEYPKNVPEQTVFNQGHSSISGSNIPVGPHIKNTEGPQSIYEPIMTTPSNFKEPNLQLPLNLHEHVSNFAEESEHGTQIVSGRHLNISGSFKISLNPQLHNSEGNQLVYESVEKLSSNMKEINITDTQIATNGESVVQEYIYTTLEPTTETNEGSRSILGQIENQTSDLEDANVKDALNIQELVNNSLEDPIFGSDSYHNHPNASKTTQISQQTPFLGHIAPYQNHLNDNTLQILSNAQLSITSLPTDPELSVQTVFDMHLNRSGTSETTSSSNLETDKDLKSFPDEIGANSNDLEDETLKVPLESVSNFVEESRYKATNTNMYSSTSDTTEVTLFSYTDVVNGGSGSILGDNSDGNETRKILEADDRTMITQIDSDPLLTTLSIFKSTPSAQIEEADTNFEDAGREITFERPSLVSEYSKTSLATQMGITESTGSSFTQIKSTPSNNEINELEISSDFIEPGSQVAEDTKSDTLIDFIRLSDTAEPSKTTSSSQIDASEENGVKFVQDTKMDISLDSIGLSDTFELFKTTLSSQIDATEETSSKFVEDPKLDTSTDSIRLSDTFESTPSAQIEEADTNSEDAGTDIPFERPSLVSEYSKTSLATQMGIIENSGSGLMQIKSTSRNIERNELEITPDFIEPGSQVVEDAKLDTPIYSIRLSDTTEPSKTTLSSQIDANEENGSDFVQDLKLVTPLDSAELSDKFEPSKTTLSSQIDAMKEAGLKFVEDSKSDTPIDSIRLSDIFEPSNTSLSSQIDATQEAGSKFVKDSKSDTLIASSGISDTFEYSKTTLSSKIDAGEESELDIERHMTESVTNLIQIDNSSTQNVSESFKTTLSAQTNVTEIPEFEIEHRTLKIPQNLDKSLTSLSTESNFDTQIESKSSKTTFSSSLKHFEESILNNGSVENLNRDLDDKQGSLNMKEDVSNLEDEYVIDSDGPSKITVGRQTDEMEGAESDKKQNTSEVPLNISKVLESTSDEQLKDPEPDGVTPVISDDSNTTSRIEHSISNTTFGIQTGAFEGSGSVLVSNQSSAPGLPEESFSGAKSELGSRVYPDDSISSLYKKSSGEGAIDDEIHAELVDERDFPNAPNPKPNTTGTHSTTTRPQPTTDDPFRCAQIGRFPHIANCSKYFYCVRAGRRLHKLTMTCPRSSQFDYVKHTCVSAPARCYHESERAFPTEIVAHTKEPPKVFSTQFKCIYPGRFPDEFDCTKYHLCFFRYKQMAQASLECPKGTRYDYRSRTCKYGEVQCFHRAMRKFECPHFGKFADPNSCESYYVCHINEHNMLDGELVKCPTGDRYDPVRRYCYSKELVRCQMDDD